ncbi:alpha/beta-hydrolase [Mycena sp. CBHHK59/15]|nr:alpha/beta-hydrolase [Mycena sp. CBHHK59/15]
MVASPLLSFAALALFPYATWAIPTSASDMTGRLGRSSASVSTPLGTAEGTSDVGGVNRFAVRYATASRWAPSTLATEWDLPNGSDDPAALPLMCPQADAEPSAYTEDCLSMILYVPENVSNAPTLMWIHGGSFISGSATDPGLDGSNLAIATQSIIAVIQYRLGALGLMVPDGSTNLAVKDTINAMKFLAQVVPSFGGDASKITLAGQSSGAGMIRVLLAAPSASSLFHNAILASDPMDYGFLSTSTQALLQSTYNDLISCSTNDLACQAALTLDEILNAQETLQDEAMSLDPSTGLGEPLRPVQDGTLPLLLTTVRNEAAQTIYQLLFPGSDPIPMAYFDFACEQSLGDVRTQEVENSPYYPLNASVDTRIPLELLGTDYIWRCPTWTLARTWHSHGMAAFVGLYTLGATYPGNEEIPFCLESGSVCHQDDIEIVFGTVPSPTSAQAALTSEMQMRFKAFMNRGNPNVPGLTPWAPATSTNANTIELGVKTTSSGLAPIDACNPNFWGAAVQYDYQFYDI